MINEEEKTLKAMGAKTARPCDSCVHKRARWYCPADDAFLCQPCDTSVHSANQLARRHERVPLGGCLRSNNLSTLNVPPSVSWPKKTRTPRHHHKITSPCAKQRHGNEGSNYLHGEEVGNFFVPDVVPEIGCEEGLLSSPIEHEDQRIHQVPVIDLFTEEDGMIRIGSETKDLDGADDLEIFQGFLASNLDFEDFDCDWKASSLVKVKEEDHGYIDSEFDNNLELASEMARETTLECGLRCPSRGVEEEDRETAMAKAVVEDKFDTVGTKFLSLNYDAVLAAWDSQGSPWTTGIRPDFDPSHCLPDCMADTTLFGGNYHLNGEMAIWEGPKGHGGLSDTERGAKVSRYREKRRSRLFSKKIRYEVRKMNAEKRPRMKGRFVKRSSTAVPVPFAYLNSNN